jgi:hypothetical protein
MANGDAEHIGKINEKNRFFSGEDHGRRLVAAVEVFFTRRFPHISNSVVSMNATAYRLLTLETA